jgi:transposase
MKKSKDRLKELERRRVRAARLLKRGVPQAEVARRVEVSRQSVSRWATTLEVEGFEALRGPGRTGRKPSLDAQQRKQLGAYLLQGALAHGFATELWTLRRVGALIERHFDVALSVSQVWRVLGQMGFSCQKPEGKARERDEQAIARWKRYRWPALKKTALETDA